MISIQYKMIFKVKVFVLKELIKYIMQSFNLLSFDITKIKFIQKNSKMETQTAYKQWFQTQLHVMLPEDIYAFTLIKQPSLVDPVLKSDQIFRQFQEKKKITPHKTHNFTENWLSCLRKYCAKFKNKTEKQCISRPLQDIYGRKQGSTSAYKNRVQLQSLIEVHRRNNDKVFKFLLRFSKNQRFLRQCMKPCQIVQFLKFNFKMRIFIEKGFKSYINH